MVIPSTAMQTHGKQEQKNRMTTRNTHLPGAHPEELLERELGPALLLLLDDPLAARRGRCRQAVLRQRYVPPWRGLRRLQPGTNTTGLRLGLAELGTTAGGALALLLLAHHRATVARRGRRVAGEQARRGVVAAGGRWLGRHAPLAGRARRRARRGLAVLLVVLLLFRLCDIGFFFLIG